MVIAKAQSLGVANLDGGDRWSLKPANLDNDGSLELEANLSSTEESNSVFSIMCK